MKNKKEKSIRKSPRFGVLDAVIILLVILAVVGVYFRYNILNIISNMRDLKEYTVTYSIENIRYTTPNFISVGDDIYFADDNEKFGTLIAASENMGALSITPASEYFTDANGNVKEVLYPNNQSRVDAQGRLDCTGRYAEDGAFLVNGSTYVAAGQYINVKTEAVTVTIRIEEIALKVAEQ
jgi:hypothetical protein